MKSEVWIISHFLGLGHGTMVCAVYLLCFYSTISRFKKAFDILGHDLSIIKMEMFGIRGRNQSGNLETYSTDRYQFVEYGIVPSHKTKILRRWPQRFIMEPYYYCNIYI